jgi:hypothetical protein
VTAPATQKRIIFVGSYMDLFNALQAAREQQDDNDQAVIAALNEEQADDREPVDEAPWMLGALAYGDMDLGTRCIISGGEVCEIDSHLESQYDERTEEDLPF